jgi:hypothetical protein
VSERRRPPRHGTSTRIATANANAPTKSRRSRDHAAWKKNKVSVAEVDAGRSSAGSRLRTQARLRRARPSLASSASARR